MNTLTLTIVGNLVDAPELRFTPSGVAACRFTVAHTPRTRDAAGGEWKDGEPTFLDCTAWRQLAENATESLIKGARVIVSGRLRTERWETDGRNGQPAGQKRSRMVLDVDAVGPELSWATATVKKMQRSGPGPADDPWATASRTRPTSPAPAGAGDGLPRNRYGGVDRAALDASEPPF